MLRSSVRKLRSNSKDLISTEILAEAAPFSFPLKNGGKEIKPAPMAYNPHLVAKVEELLEQIKR